MYDSIADLYHLVYDDWNAAIARQASALDKVIANSIGPAPHSLLDVSCGIGTQALGMAALDYQVTAAQTCRQAQWLVHDAKHKAVGL